MYIHKDMLKTESNGRTDVHTFNFEYFMSHVCNEKDKVKVDLQLALARNFLHDDLFKPKHIELTFTRSILVNIELIDERIESPQQIFQL